MARRRRNRRRRQSSWAAQGDAETVIEFSRHRMIETLSAHQLDALQTLAGLRELELQVQAFMAALGTGARMQQRQLDAVRDGLQQLPDLNESQRRQMLDTLGQLAQSLPHLRRT